MRKVIEIKGLSYRYAEGTQALRGVDLEVFWGESMALIGPNGAGKSTLLLHLNGILRGEGLVKVLGKKLTKGNARGIRGKVGLVFQDPEDQLFSTTVFEDVAFGPLNMGHPKEEIKGRVTRALGQVGMEGYEERCPHHLSYGEKKRIALATVLSMEPEILVLDEPTSNLDPSARRSLIGLLKQLKLTKVVATHDMEVVAEVCERVILLSRGEVVADGGAREILTDVDLLEAHELEPPPVVRLFRQMGATEIPLTIEEVKPFILEEVLWEREGEISS